MAHVGYNWHEHVIRKSCVSKRALRGLGSKTNSSSNIKFSLYQTLRLQQQLSCRLPPLQILMRRYSILEVISLVDLDVKLTTLDQVQDAMGIILQFFPSRNIVVESCAHDSQIFRG